MQPAGWSQFVVGEGRAGVEVAVFGAGFSEGAPGMRAAGGGVEGCSAHGSCGEEMYS